ncbi:ANTAR domain-containing protein [Streptomyces sp. NPDC002853]
MGQTAKGQAEKVVGGDATLESIVVELRAVNEQLQRALASRVVIDQSIGMVMVLAPCSNVTAWSLLVEVSQHSNVKLREVAAALVAAADGAALPEPLREELRRALRRPHAEIRRRHPTPAAGTTAQRAGP